ncbi:MAG: ABC transporter ATP-binding protein [Clostridia bacterium]|nr:ABC transporter ATP-binding protein [Clostridia bacterium]
MKHILSYLKHYRREAVLGPFFKLIEAMFDLFVPLVVAAIIDQGIGAGDRGYVFRASGILVLLAFLGLVFAILAQYFAARAAVGTAEAMRYALFEKANRLSFSDLDRLGTSTVITRLTGDTNQVQTGINMVLRLFLRSPFIVFGAMIMAFTVDVRSALVFAVAIPLLSVAVFAIMLISIPLYRRVQARLDTVLLKTRESLSGARVMRAFCREGAEVDEFGRENRALSAIQKLSGRISSLMNPVTYLLINIAIIALLQVGAIRIDSGELTQGQLIALYNYMTQILVELIKLANLIITTTKAFASARRIGNVLDMTPSLSLLPDDGTRHDTHAVAFDRVCLTYPGAGAPSLSGISFTADRGETVGIIGGTGSGKTSLVNLIPHFYDATEGRVTVDGQDVKTMDTVTLRQRIGIVPQKALLFRGTVRENLLWGNENATDEQIEEALAAAVALDVVASKGGLDAAVLEGGSNFSGGQRQRLSIARALVRRPEILILDDSASALDYATDAKLRRALKELSYHPTVFIVSQRTSSLQHADRIVVLEDGEAIGIGTHEELLADCEVYREIYDSQYRGGEVTA